MRRLAVTIGLAGFLAASRTWADGESDRTKLYQEGKALADAGNYAAAAEKFRAVIAIRTAPKAVIALAAVEEKQGHLLAARALYARAEHDALAAKLDDDQSVAAAGRARCDAELPRLTVRLPAGVSTAKVLVDGRPMPSPFADEQVDPGSHAIVASADGYRTFETTIAIARRERRTVDAVMSPVTTPGDTPSHAWLPLGVAGGGAAVGVAGLFVQLSGRADERARERECPNFVCPAGESTDNPGRTKILVGDVMMVAGAVAAVGGIIWYFARTAPGSRVAGQLTPSPTGVTIFVSGAF